LVGLTLRYVITVGALLGLAHRKIHRELMRRKKAGDQHLRSVAEVIGYHVHATDGEIGHVEEFLAEESG
jgi:hypothetical protein